MSSAIGPDLPGIDTAEVLEWIRAGDASEQDRISRGHQAEVYLYRQGNTPLVLKVAYGYGFAAWLRRWMLRKEERVYRRLQHVDGIPKCYGLLDGKYLLLEYFKSESYRGAELRERDRFFDSLRRMIEAMHAAGVAHGDLKTRSNIMVTPEGQPRIVDFGIATTCKPGFAPFNHWLFNMFVQFDRNAWIKLKYKKRMHEITLEDEPYYHVTWLERLARKVRNLVRRARRKFGRR